jgi:16S rRNA (uracil1498-N3)-methyltransferase
LPSILFQAELPARKITPTSRLNSRLPLARLSLFYIKETRRVGCDFKLDSERSNYLCRVLRLSVGDKINLFDGHGSLYTAAISQANPRGATVLISAEEKIKDTRPYQLKLAVALIKGPAMDRALQRATELGASQIQLLQTDRSNVALKAERIKSKLDHWMRVISSSCEQCGQLFLPRIEGPITLQQAIEKSSNSIVFEPSGQPFPSKLNALDRTLFVGPEGGWSDNERALFNNSEVATYKLGNTILRAETVPGIALGLVQQAQGWL